MYKENLELVVEPGTYNSLNPNEESKDFQVHVASFWTKSKRTSRYSISVSQPKRLYQLPELDHLAPKWENIKAFKNQEITWEEYTNRYLELLKQRFEDPLGESILEYLSAQTNLNNITLCCWEKEDDPHCHRKIVYDLIPERHQGERK